jgi:hypothetical protein
MVVADGIGQLRRAIPGGISALSNYIFPIGDLTTAADYSPVTLGFTSTSATPTTRIIGARVTDAQHPDDTSVNDYISRYWSLTDSETGNGSYIYSGTFTYSTAAPSDLIGAHANLRINRWNGSLWTQYVTSGTSPSIGFTSQTELTSPIGGNEFTGRVNPAQPFVWQPTSGTHDFQDPLNWLPNRVSPQTDDILSFTNTGASTAENVPTQVVGQIIVGNNTDISFAAETAGARFLSISGPPSTNNLNIASGSTLQLSGTSQLTLRFLTNPNQQANIAGSLVINDNGSLNNSFLTNTVATTVVTVANGGVITNNGGIVTGTAPTLQFAGGSFYNHAMNGGTLAVATWDNTSTLNITGIEATNPTWYAGPFGNLIWNCTAQTATGAIPAMTINNNFSILAGTINAGTNIITGNTSGTFTVGNGATYITTRSATPWFPSNYTNAVLQNGSVFDYASATAHAIPNSPTTNYGVLSLTGGVQKTLTSAISVHGITLNTSGAVLNDDGFVITGPGAGSGTFNMVNGSQFITTNTNVNPMPVFQTYTFGSTSRVNYNATSNTNISSLPDYGQLYIAGAAAKALTGTTIVQDQVVAGLNAELNFNGQTLRIAGATPFSNNASAIMTANAAGSTIELNSSVAQQTLTLAGTITGGIIDRIISSNTFNSGLSTTTGLALGTTPAIYNVNNVVINPGAFFNLRQRTLNLHGLLSNNGTLIANEGTATLAFTGSAAQNFNPGTLESGVINNLIVNNATGVTLQAPLNIANVFTLTNGVFNTSGINLLTLLNTAVGAVSGGSVTSYVNGPLARTLPINLTSGIYNWPVGKAEYQLFRLNNPTTANTAGNVVVQVEAFDSPTGGTAGFGVNNLLSDHRWQAQITSNASNFISSGRVGIHELGLINSTHHITRSQTATGTYSLFSSTYVSPLLEMNTAPDNLLGFYMIGESGGTISGPVTVGTGGNFPSLTNSGGLFDIINNSTVTGNVTASIISDLPNETGTFALNEWSELPVASNFTLRIQPNAATQRIITNTGNNTSGATMIPFNGADRVTIDGQFNNDGNRWLLFRHTNTSIANTGPVITLNNSSENNIIRNTILEQNNSNTGRGVVTISTTGSNSSNSIINNEIRSTSVGTLGAYVVGVLSSSATNNNLIISDNHFYQTENSTTAQTIISLTGASSGHTISNNSIGGSAINAGGSAWTNSGTTVNFIGIQLPTGTANLSTVSGNIIQNIEWNGTSTAAFTGINAGNGLFNITNNTIGHASAANSITVAGTTTTTGIIAASTNNTNITNNTIANMTAFGTGTSVAIRGIVTSGTSGVYNIANNNISNLSASSTSAGTGLSASVVGIANSATGSGLNIEGNSIYGLNNVSSTGVTQVTGIVNTANIPATNSNNITRNFVHSFSTASADARQTGILAADGLLNVTNNMVRLGIDATGANHTVPSTIVGIEKLSVRAMNFFHNNVYIGGTGRSCRF